MNLLCTSKSHYGNVQNVVAANAVFRARRTALPLWPREDDVMRDGAAQMSVRS